MKNRKNRCLCGNKLGRGKNQSHHCAVCLNTREELNVKFDRNNLRKVVILAYRRQPVLALANLFLARGMSEEEVYKQLKAEGISDVVKCDITCAIRDIKRDNKFHDNNMEVMYAINAEI